MNILFLDDCPQRTKFFRSNCPSAHCVETAKEVIDILSKDETIDALFLDHDLGGLTFVDSNRPDTGMEVVRWIISNHPNIKKIIVHSLNDEAAFEMITALKDAGYLTERVPFLRLNCDAITRLTTAS